MPNSDTRSAEDDLRNQIPMNEMRPGQVRAIASLFFDFEVHGVVTSPVLKKGAFVSAIFNHWTLLVCTQNEMGWMIGQVKKSARNNVILAADNYWDSRLQDQKNNAPRMLQYAGVNIQSVQMQYVKRIYDKQLDISRAAWNTPVGKIVIHTQANKRGTRVMIEVCDKRVVVHYVWERKLGGADLSRIRVSDALEF